MTRVAIGFFVPQESVSSFSVAVTIFHFVYDLTVSLACLRHHSTRTPMRKTVMPLEGRRSGDSCRNWFFGGAGKCFVSFCHRHFLHFVCDLTVSQA